MWSIRSKNNGYVSNRRFVDRETAGYWCDYVNFGKDYMGLELFEVVEVDT